MKSLRDKEIIEETKTEEVEKVESKPKKYIVTVPNLARREGPGFDFEKLGLAEAGHTLITDIDGEWGKLADGSGWVNMKYLRKAD